MGILKATLEAGLIYGIVAMGVYITYRILDFPDLSVDGTFPLGASVAAALIFKGGNPYLASVIAVLAGCAAGFVTGILHVKLKISNLLSGILVMIALYSINLRVMGKSNTAVFGKNMVFIKGLEKIVIILAFAIVVKIILDLFLKTKLGFMLKAVGDNEQLVTSLSVDKDKIKVLGLMLSNGIVALAGAIWAQYQGYADVTMGTGTVVIGLAAVILGDAVFGRIKLVKATTAVVLGSVIYQGAIALTLNYSGLISKIIRVQITQNDTKLITAIIVVIALCFNNRSFNVPFKKKSALGGESDAASTESV